MRILGIDPGSVVMGYGVIETQGSKLIHLDNGGIYPTTQQKFSERLPQIYDKIEQLIHQFQPDMAAVENVFYGKNVQSMLKLGQARGAAVLAVLKSKIPLFEYSPTQVKMAVTGFGRASKEQVQKMVKLLLHLQDVAMKDASDALAVAICHQQSYKLLKKMSAQ